MRKGDLLLIIEAMEIEIEINAQHDATVEVALVVADVQIDSKDLLIKLE